MKPMQTAINQIKSDKMHGASYLTDKALEALKNAVQTSEACNPREFLQEISGLASGLSECRPAMVSIGNCSLRFISELQKYSANNLDLKSLRDFALTIVEHIQHECTRARNQVIEAGAGLITDRDLIMTCSYSSTIIQVVTFAHKQGKTFRLLAARSREFPEDIAYGDKMASGLAGYGIECQVYSDGDIHLKTKQADKVIVGADAIFPDGSLLNGYPTAPLALAAAGANIPFYTVCESNKFLSRDMPATIEKGFNLVPSRLITGIVCEHGIITPNHVPGLV